MPSFSHQLISKAVLDYEPTMLNLSPVRPRSVDNPSILAFPILLLSMNAKSHKPNSHGTRCQSNLRVRARSKAGSISSGSGEESWVLIFSVVSTCLPALILGRTWSEIKLGAVATEAILTSISAKEYIYRCSWLVSMSRKLTWGWDDTSRLK